MVEEFSKAFHSLFDKENKKVECPQEDDFVKLHDVLGDREKQDEIRSKNKDGKHCFDLMASPNACIGCPKNPIEAKDKKKHVDDGLVRKHGTLIDRITTLYDWIDMGMVRDLGDVSLLEGNLLRIVHNFHRGMGRLF